MVTPTPPISSQSHEVTASSTAESAAAASGSTTTSHTNTRTSSQPPVSTPAPTAAAATAVSTSTTREADGREEENFAPDLSASGPEGLAPGAFRAFFENQNLLPPANKNKAKYILLMSTDLHNAALMDVYNEDVNTAVTNSESPSSVTLPTLLTPEKFIESNEVFEPLLTKRGMKTKLIASRKDLHNELLRRKPDAFSARLTEYSENNTKTDQYMKELLKYI